MISPTPAPATSRRFGAFTMVLGVMVLAGCTPSPAPTPTPTAAFASEEEAFAAAEETYRAYTDAVSNVDFGDASTFETVYVHLSGSSAASTKKVFSEFQAAGLRTVGVTRYDSFAGVSASLTSGRISATVCVDVSDVDVVDREGRSIVTPDRPDRQPMLITFETSRASANLTIATQDPTDQTSCVP